MGTAAGLSASYIKFPVPESKMISMEGCSNLASVAENTFRELNIQNIEIRTGDFENTLPEVLQQIKKLDFVFFDGNHRKEATLGYFSQCIEKITENSLFVFDDIHWSPGMAEAWNSIKSDSRVMISIDLFWLGLVFFRKGTPKQDFVIRY
jgi:predicted O-methyltransferase YrrM